MRTAGNSLREFPAVRFIWERQRPWRGLLVLGTAACLAGAVIAQEPAKPIPRYIASLKLGDTMDQIKLVYQPTRDWSKHREPGGLIPVVRHTIERGTSKWFPADIETVRVGMRLGRLVHIQVIYDRERSREKPLSELAADLSITYGEPRRAGETYFWLDGDTVLAASNAELPTPRGEGVELRTCLELMERGYFEPLR